MKQIKNLQFLCCNKQQHLIGTSKQWLRKVYINHVHRVVKKDVI